jgi:acyl carrier protein
VPRGEQEPEAGSVAVCTLGSTELVPVLRAVGCVGLAGSLRTANLGIEQIIWAVLRRPWIRHLVVCGRDSPLFRQGQSLVALVRCGIDRADHRIVGAAGHLPFLRGVLAEEVDAFRRQVTLTDLRDVVDAGDLRRRVAALAAHAQPNGSAVGASPNGSVAGTPPGGSATDRAAGRWPGRRRRFRELPAAGRREPVTSAGEGFFVVSVSRCLRQITVEHYHADLAPGHRLRGHGAEPLLLGLVGAGLVRSPAHAGYLGAELAKAEIALRLGLEYEQDRPLRRPPVGSPATGGTKGMINSVEQFARFIAETVGAGDVTLKPDQPLNGQLAVDSIRMMELAVALEQDLGVDLPEDLDLRMATAASLYHQYTAD